MSNVVLTVFASIVFIVFLLASYKIITLILTQFFGTYYIIEYLADDGDLKTVKLNSKMDKEQQAEALSELSQNEVHAVIENFINAE